MESTPLYPPTPEDDDDEAEDKPIKNIFSRESAAKKEAKSQEEVGGEIAKSLFTHNNSQEPSAEQEGDGPLLEISHEDEVIIHQALAQEHLEHPVVGEQPLPEVNDFLDRVVEGEEPEQAFEQVLGVNDPEDDLGVENIDSRETHPVEPEGVTSTAEVPPLSNDNLPPETPIIENPNQPLEGRSVIAPPGNVAVGENTQPTNNRPRNLESSRQDNEVVSRSISGELAAYIVGRRIGERKTRESVAKKQKQLGKKIKQMEGRLQEQELIIQQVSQKKKVEARKVTPPERTQPGSRESRLNLTKPEQAGHLGQILVESKALGITKVSNEVQPVAQVDKPSEVLTTPDRPSGIPLTTELPQPISTNEVQPIVRENTGSIEERKTKDNKNQLRDVVKPEQIKTIPRNELLRISQSIVVEGANLRSMHESNLFGEQALRRLVAEKLKGKDIRPMLKREILEKQRDFERDPMVRGRAHFQSETGSQIFTKMLDQSTPNQPLNQGANNKPKPSTQKVDSRDNSNTKKDKQLADNTSKPLLLLVIIIFVAIILLAAYLLLHH